MPHFWKMNGLGNDFAIVDARAEPFAADGAAIRSLARRDGGIGFDQLITLLPPAAGGDVFMRIHNADGGEVAACGNATRCVAALVMAERGTDSAAIETAAGRLDARAISGGGIAVDMGEPRLSPGEIPFAADAGDSLAVSVAAAEAARLGPGTCVGLGNPHVVFFVDDPEAVDLAAVGPAIEHDPLFPERVNASFAAVLDEGELSARVWERGAGATLACGTAACAIVVAAHMTGRAGRRARVHLPGGALDIAWDVGGRIEMEGPVAHEFEGTVAADGSRWQAGASTP